MIYLIPCLIGSFVVISPILNGRNAVRLGTLSASFYNYFSATFFAVSFSLLFMSTSGDQDMQILKHLASMPPWAFLGGIIGAFVILLMNYFTVRIEAFYIVILPFLGQMLMGVVLDSIIGNSLSLRQILGIVVLLVGLVIVAIKKRPT